MSTEVTVTQDTFEQEVLKADTPVVVDFWAEWCGPCKAFAPTLEKFAEAHSDIKVCKIDVDNAPNVARDYSVMSIPTILFFKDGSVMDTAVGNLSLNDLEDRAKNAFGGNG